jgi:hypothetical protein
MSDANYAWYLTLDEMLLECMKELEAARRAETDPLISFHLRQASRALRSAMLVYADGSAIKVRNEEDK